MNENTTATDELELLTAIITGEQWYRLTDPAAGISHKGFGVIDRFGGYDWGDRVQIIIAGPSGQHYRWIFTIGARIEEPPELVVVFKTTRVVTHWTDDPALTQAEHNWLQVAANTAEERDIARARVAELENGRDQIAAKLATHRAISTRNQATGEYKNAASRGYDRALTDALDLLGVDAKEARYGE